MMKVVESQVAVKPDGQPAAGAAGVLPPAPPDSDVVVSVRNVGKMYRLYDRPQDRLKEQLFWRFGKHFGREFWALRDASFDVRRGEQLGIIGRNGSGKSTLLQMIAGTLSPTTGEIQVRGRVAALLELGSGFNPEFTGRENVFMNGAVLGLSPDEIAARFDDIAAFADIGSFIDQPVKLYSTGMLVRLSFAVTTSVNADALLIDEALAVGDVFFHQKCFGRLERLCDEGVSLILVSHVMADIQRFCRAAIVLQRGNLVFQGESAEAVKRYFVIEQAESSVALRTASARSAAKVKRPATDTATGGDAFWPSPDAFLDSSQVTQVSNGWARCTGFALCDGEGRPCGAFEQGEKASFFFEFELATEIEVPIGGVVIKNSRAVNVHGLTTLLADTNVPTWTAAGCRLRFRYDVDLNVAIDAYTFDVSLSALSWYDYQNRHESSQQDYVSRVIRVCHIPNAGQFEVVFRGDRPGWLLHLGVANLAGQFRVESMEPAR